MMRAHIKAVDQDKKRDWMQKYLLEKINRFSVEEIEEEIGEEEERINEDSQMYGLLSWS